MAFTISNLESVAHKQQELQSDGDDWKSLIDENIKRDEISIANEFIRDRQK